MKARELGRAEGQVETLSPRSGWPSAACRCSQSVGNGKRPWKTLSLVLPKVEP